MSHSVRSRLTPSGRPTETTLYSCQDVSAALGTTMPTLAANETVDEEGSTTSGSYVVDANDLCNEIDDLFFRSMVV